jgi:molybdopterin-containing oxidoreductase family iron-sulfur binding subunit
MSDERRESGPAAPGASSDDRSPSDVSRRRFVAGAGALVGLAALASQAPAAAERFLRRRFRELSPEQVAAYLEELEEGYRARYGRELRVTNTPPMERTSFGYGLDLSRCVGCRRCVYACVHENNQSRNPQVQWIRVLQMEKERGVRLSESDAYYDPPEVPEEDYFYLPAACMQCAKPPCTKACPVKATWQEPDGIVVIDYDWCIGCRCCMAACPYGARRFNWTEPQLSPDEVNPDMHVLGNRPRPPGVVEKCTFCIHRVRAGRYPACVEICPVGARKFGNLLDEESEIRILMRDKRVFVLKEELNTQPRFFYFFAT